MGTDEEDEEDEEVEGGWHLQLTWSSTEMMALSYWAFLFMYWIFIT